jgi:hypothetical protein
MPMTTEEKTLRLLGVGVLGVGVLAVVGVIHTLTNTGLIGGKGAKPPVVALEAAASEGTSYSVWTITIKPSATATKCTADNPWQSLYTRTTSGNDQIKFRSLTGVAYRIHFTLGTPLNDMNGTPANDIPVPAAGFSNLYVAQNVTCTDKDGITVPCAYPYNILTGGVAGPQCNNGNSPPDGSDGIVIKGGGG